MNERELSIAQHLRELRKRVTLSVIAVVITTSVAFAFHQQILTLLMQPAQGFEGIPNGKPVYTDLTEFIGAAFKASLLVGVFSALPFILYQFVMFIAPGLNPKERRYLYALLPISFLAFVAGATFGYLVLIPPAVNFLLTFGDDVATPFIRIGNYVNLVVRLIFWLGIIFEMPIVMFFLTKIGIVTSDFLASKRRYAIVAAFILAAIITPTIDPINQSFVAAPIIVMYELGIWLPRIALRRKKESVTEATNPH